MTIKDRRTKRTADIELLILSQDEDPRDVSHLFFDEIDDLDACIEFAQKWESGKAPNDDLVPLKYKLARMATIVRW